MPFREWHFTRYGRGPRTFGSIQSVFENVAYVRNLGRANTLMIFNFVLEIYSYTRATKTYEKSSVSLPVSPFSTTRFRKQEQVNKTNNNTARIETTNPHTIAFFGCASRTLPCHLETLLDLRRQKSRMTKA